MFRCLILVLNGGYRIFPYVITRCVNCILRWHIGPLGMARAHVVSVSIGCLAETSQPKAHAMLARSILAIEIIVCLCPRPICVEISFKISRRHSLYKGSFRNEGQQSKERFQIESNLINRISISYSPVINKLGAYQGPSNLGAKYFKDGSEARIPSAIACVCFSEPNSRFVNLRLQF